jgi:hypothetical protein
VLYITGYVSSYWLSLCRVINLTGVKETRQFDMSDCIFPRERWRRKKKIIINDRCAARIDLIFVSVVREIGYSKMFTAH